MNMLERAAREIWNGFAARLGGDYEEGSQLAAAVHCRANARAALLAALDPEDEALVEIVARAMCLPPETEPGGILLRLARQAIAALRQTAQGEQQ